MKKLITSVLLLSIIQFSFALSITSTPKNTIEVLGNAQIKTNLQSYNLGLRYMRNLGATLAFGAETNFKQTRGEYGNYDQLKGILFARLSVIKGFYAEIGGQTQGVISSCASRTKNHFIPQLFGAVGYQKILYKNLGISAQVRTNPENNNTFKPNPQLMLGLQIGF